MTTGTRLYWHAGRWVITPVRSAPRRYRPLREAAYRAWVARGMPFSWAGGYWKRKRRRGR